jgi:hypothetical protein
VINQFSTRFGIFEEDSRKDYPSLRDAQKIIDPIIRGE